MNALKISFIALTLCLVSCDSSKKTTAEATQEAEANAKIMIEKGFVMGTIVDTKNTDCPYIINVEGDADNKVSFDPMNLEDSFKKDGAKIWFTYRPLRRQNRCNLGTPVTINTMQKREN